MAGLYLAVFLISGCALGYEILLMRLLSVIQWHHFAHMIISLALLGYGASGTFLAVFRSRIVSNFDRAFVANTALFGISAAGCYALSGLISFNPLEIFWNPGQLVRLGVLYTILAVPFFFAANCIGMALIRYGEQIPRIYKFDLLGAGFGALAIVAVLLVMRPETALKCIGGLGFLASALFVSSLPTVRLKAWKITGLLFGGILFAALWPQSALSPAMSSYKGLALALLVPDAEIVAERSSPLGLLTVVESPTIPFRYAPGLSLNCPHVPPEQLGLFTDGDSMSPINRFDGSAESAAYTDCMSSALPYHLLDRPKTLILGGGGGADVLVSFYHDVPDVSVVELNPQVVDLVGNVFSDYAGGVYTDKRVRVHIAEARSFVSRSRERFGLISMSPADSFGVSAAGGYALNESYLYTVEAFLEYYRVLEPGGMLSVTRWLKNPPRDCLKLFATAVTALGKAGVEDPGRSMLFIRSWKTGTLLVKKGAFTPAETDAARAFCRERSFDIAYCPDVRSDEVNRFNMLPEPYYYRGALALLGDERDEYTENYKFDIRPPTDDRPYFFHFFKWRTLPEILSLRGEGSSGLMEWPYPIAVLTLLMALAVSMFIVLLPLVLFLKVKRKQGSIIRPALFFLSLGLAFLFVEISFIQRFVLFLGHPLTAASVILSSFLVFAGLGSGYCARRSKTKDTTDEKGYGAAIAGAVFGIVCVGVLYLFILPPLFHRLIALPLIMRIAVTVLLVSPLAFFMGMPFPLGLSMLRKTMPDFVPWAWGFNGCASVLSAVLAVIVAVNFGFTIVILAAMVLYGFGAFLSYRSFR